MAHGVGVWEFSSFRVDGFQISFLYASALRMIIRILSVREVCVSPRIRAVASSFFWVSGLRISDSNAWKGIRSADFPADQSCRVTIQSFKSTLATAIGTHSGDCFTSLKSDNQRMRSFERVSCGFMSSFVGSNGSFFSLPSFPHMSKILGYCHFSGFGMTCAHFPHQSSVFNEGKSGWNGIAL